MESSEADKAEATTPEPPLPGSIVSPTDGGDEASEPGVSTEAAKKKKKKKKKKKAGETNNGEDGDVSASTGTEAGESDATPRAPPAASASAADVQKAIRAAQLMAKIKALEARPTEAEKDPSQRDYKFWKTQPVPQYGEAADTEGPLEADKPLSELRQEPLALPGGFEWESLDINDPKMLDELYALLNENYVEDDDNMFRFDYSRDFLKWALKPPGCKTVWYAAVRQSGGSRKLRGFISAIPATLRIREKNQHLVEINFLCVHKKLRSHRLAPVLIREITRRVNCEGLFQAVYTAGVVLPTPVAKCRYWHRSLDPKKLIEVKFSYLPRGQTMAKLIRKLKLPTEPTTPGLRKMTEADVGAAWKMTEAYLKKFTIAPTFTSQEEFAHWLLPRDGVISTFVVEDPETHEITDMISYYTLPSTIVHHPEHKLLKAAYSFYNVPGKTDITQLMQDALTLAKADEFDVFNALDLMENSTFLEPLQFGKGDGNLQYYLYNYRFAEVKSQDIGLVLL
eukprot:m.175036 g.175036  ORF g.175036 m.175036 type:complete len:510 (+) comp13918_c0_seq1:68-1597(+)